MGLSGVQKASTSRQTDLGTMMVAEEVEGVDFNEAAVAGTTSIPRTHLARD